MFGKNPLSGPMHDQQHFVVQSLFVTLQGEGPYAGVPALFVRLGKCNLRCHFCDTEFSEGNANYTPEHLANSLNHMLAEFPFVKLLVLTGGEPMLQNVPLFWRTIREHVGQITMIQIETAGTVWPKGMEDCLSYDSKGSVRIPELKIIVSPKTPNVHKSIRQYAMAWKYIVQEPLDKIDGLPVMSTQEPGKVQHVARPNSGSLVYLSPMDEYSDEQNKRNLKLAADACIRHGHTLTVQMHKLVGIP